MNWKKILSKSLLIGVIIVLISIIPDAGNYILAFLIPPRIYILIGIIVCLILWKILIELRNRNNKDGDE